MSKIKTSSRLLSLVLALVMVITMVPQMAFAAEQDGTAPGSKNYTIKVETTPGETVTCDKQTAAEGETVTVSTVTKEGYVFYEWQVLDEKGNKITVEKDKFTMPASNVKVKARAYEKAYEKDVLELEALNDKINKMNPDDYTKESWNSLTELTNGMEPLELGQYARTYIGLIQERVDALVPVKKYDITFEATPGETVSADKKTAGKGETVKLTAQTKEGYVFYEWKVTDEKGNQIKVEKDSFIMPASKVKVKARAYEKAYEKDVLELEALNNKINKMNSDDYTKESWNALTELTNGMEPLELGQYARTYIGLIQERVDALVPVTSFDIKVETTPGVTVTVDKKTALERETVKLTAQTKEGYVFYEWKVTDEKGDQIKVEKDSFVMPASKVKVKARAYEKAYEKDVLALEALVNKVNAMNPEDYTPESWRALTELTNGIEPLELGQYASTYIGLIQEKIDALKPAENKPSPGMKLEDGSYLVPFQTYRNEEKTLEGQILDNSGIHALVEAKNGVYKVTIRLTDRFNRIDCAGVLNEEMYKGTIMADENYTWIKYRGTKCFFDPAVAAKNGAKEEYNKNWKDVTIKKSVKDNVNVYDITFEISDLSKDYLMVSGSDVEILDFNENILHKTSLDEVKTFTEVPYEFAGEYGVFEFLKNLPATLKWTVKNQKAVLTIPVGKSMTDKYDIKINKKPVADGKCDIEFDLTDLNDSVLGQCLDISTTEKASQKKAWKNVYIYPMFKKAEILELAESITGSKILTNTFVLPKGTTLLANELKDDPKTNTDPYSIIMERLGSSYKNMYMYNWSVKYPDGKESISMSSDVEMRFKIPSNWNSKNVQLFGYWEGYGFDPAVDGKVVTESSGDKYFVTTGKTLGNYALYEKKDLSSTGENLEDGTYSIPLSVYHLTTEGQLSMADRCLGDNAKLVVKDGIKTIYLDFTIVENIGLTSYMSNMWLYDENVKMDNNSPKGDKTEISYTSYYRNSDGSFLTDEFNKDTYNFYPKTGYVKLASDEAKWPARFKVPVMDSIGGGNFEQDAWLTLDWANIKKTNGETPDAPINDAIKEELEIVNMLVKNDYTSGSWKVLIEAKEKLVAEQGTGTVDQLQASYEALRAARKALVSSTVDYKALENKLAEAKAIKADKYTEETFAVLTKAIKDAEKVLNNDAATQDDVNNAVKALDAAIKGLVLKESGKLDINNLEDGVYIIHGDMVKIDKAETSMADNAINHNVMLTVKDGRYYITLDFKGMKIGQKFGYLGELKYFLSGYDLDQYGRPIGDTKNATVDSLQFDKNGNVIKDQYGTNYPDKVTFELIPEALEDGFVPLQVYVPIMESIAQGTGTQEVFLKLAWNTIEKTTTDDDRFTPEAGDNDVVNPNEKPENKPSVKPENKPSVKPETKPGVEGETPETGDENNMLPWMALALAAGTAVVALRKKED